MRPSQFIKASYRKNIQDRAIPIKYYPFLTDSVTVDPLTAEPVDENLAYGPVVELPAWVIENPGRSYREAFGLTEERFIVAEIHMDEVIERGIVFHSGDKFEHDKTTYFMRKAPERTGQDKAEYLLIRLALEYVEGRSEVLP